jgi:hypothetical protein
MFCRKVLRALVNSPGYEAFMERTDRTTASTAMRIKGRIANTDSTFSADVKWAIDVLMPFVSGIKELEADTAKLSDGFFLVLGLSEHVKAICDHFGSFTNMLLDKDTAASTLVLAHSFTTTFQEAWTERSAAVMTPAVVATAMLDPRYEIQEDCPNVPHTETTIQLRTPIKHCFVLQVQGLA